MKRSTRTSDCIKKFAGGFAFQASIIQCRSVFLDSLVATQPHIKHPLHQDIQCTKAPKASRRWRSIGLISRSHFKPSSLVQQFYQVFAVNHSGGVDLWNRSFNTACLSITRIETAIASESPFNRQSTLDLLCSSDMENSITHGSSARSEKASSGIAMPRSQATDVQH
jgi:hypothetical protein